MTPENRIWNLYESNKRVAFRALQAIPIARGRTPNISGLNGWVFERVIADCLIRELRHRGIRTEPEEQVPFATRAKADLRIATVIVEIKLSGLFGGGDIVKYRRYRLAAKKSGLTYLYLTGGESYKPYRDGITKVFGKADSFFLDRRGDWNRFITRVAMLLKKHSRMKALQKTISIAKFIRAIRDLPSDRPRIKSGIWYKTQKEHWLGWLSEYHGPGYYGRTSKKTRDARFAYNHINCPNMLLWLAKAAGVRPNLVTAAHLGSSRATSLMQESATIRKHIPWQEIERSLWR